MGKLHLRSAALACVVCLAAAPAARAQDPDLTGTWYGPNGVTLSVRQVGRDVWWVARSGDGGKEFTAVFHGKMTGNILTGQFADVPDGRNRYDGGLKAKVVVRDGKVSALDGEIFFPGDQNPRPWSITRIKPQK